MTGQEERLNRIADRMGDLAQKMEELTQKIEGTSKRFKNNIRLVRRMRDVMALTAEERREIIGDIAQEQSEIRAIQAETYRSLQMLKNRPHQDDNPDT